MFARQYPHDKSEHIDSAQTPAINMSWRFGDLPAVELLPLLQRHLAVKNTDLPWNIIWLNNDGRPVLGLLPKVTWLVYFDDTNSNHKRQTPFLPSSQTASKQPSLYKVIETCRDDDNSVTTAHMSYAEWQAALIRYSQNYDTGNGNNASESINDRDKTPSYHHGLMGFIGYDIAANELSPAANSQQAAQPCAFIGHYDIYLSPSDTDTVGWTLHIETRDTDIDIDIDNDNDNDNDTEPASSTLAALMSYLDALDIELANIAGSNKPQSPLAPLKLNAQWNKLNYQQAFEQTQRYLQQGDCYQINLTQAWQGQLATLCSDSKTVTTLVDYLPALHRNTKAPFAGYLGISCLQSNRLQNNKLSETDNHSSQSSLEFELLSCSPELFFTFIKDGHSGRHNIRTKPIKGTRPRGMNTKHDLALKQQLIDSDKDRAENVMIVDLLRNDLGKYAKIGSVQVPHLFTIESFSNVHHMVSTITAELKTDTHPLAVLFGSLPAGSITGTPKRRAVEIISELEKAARGAYCGTMGYMNFDGSGQWNVLIRTLQADMSSSKAGQVSLWAGGGITIASDCDAEYQECLDKVGNLLDVLTQVATVT